MALLYEDSTTNSQSKNAGLRPKKREWRSKNIDWRLRLRLETKERDWRLKKEAEDQRNEAGDQRTEAGDQKEAGDLRKEAGH